MAALHASWSDFSLPNISLWPGTQEMMISLSVRSCLCHARCINLCHLHHWSWLSTKPWIKPHPLDYMLSHAQNWHAAAIQPLGCPQMHEFRRLLVSSNMAESPFSLHSSKPWIHQKRASGIMYATKCINGSMSIQDGHCVCMFGSYNRFYTTPHATLMYWSFSNDLTSICQG